MIVFAVILMVFGIVALIICSVLLRGFVLSILWGWFISPVFNLPNLSILQAIGISMVIAMFTITYTVAKEDDKDKWKPAVMSIMYPLLSLAIGWILKGFM